MRFLSLFSGIEGASVAWAPLGWECAGFSEIDRFCCALLAHRFPEVANLGDVSKVSSDEIGPIDLCVFGSPCQSFSIAGKRAGLDDPRGNLALVALGLVNRVRPRWFLFENVSGLLSSDKGRDFQAFLNAAGQCGYFCAWRVLDAQYFGIPQRRRRLFVVGYLGDWRPPAAVLFEPQSLQGNRPPRRETGQGITGGPESDPGPGWRPIIGALTARSGRNGGMANDDFDAGKLVAFGGANASGPVDLATAVRAKGGSGHGDFESETFIVGTLPSGGSPQGHGVAGINNQAVAAGHIIPVAIAIQERAICENPDAGPDGAGFRADGQAYTLEARQVPQAVAFQPGNLRRGAGSPPSEDCFPTLKSDHGRGLSDQAPCVALQSAVRRLTPRECERLQGFPDDWTLIPYRGKLASDGPRYRAIGNSFPVPVIRWLGQRIGAVDEILAAQARESAA